jgi:hypothetical protein
MTSSELIRETIDLGKTRSQVALKVHDQDMNGLEFTSTLLTHLFWPLVVAGSILLFRKPLSELIGRVRRYEGLGQKLEFGERLAEAEDSVGKAVRATSVAGEQAKIESSPLVRDAEENPSYVVLQAWEQLSGAIADLVGMVFPEMPNWARQNPAQEIPALRKRELVTADFADAVTNLRLLRNQVAHGQSKPTPGEAVAYAESAQALATIARNIANLLTNPPLKSTQ